MSNFGFEIILTLNDFNTFTIQPPYSLIGLREIANEKFNTPKAELYYLNSEEEKLGLINDQDYFDMFNFISENGLKEINVYIHTDDKVKKKTANRKNSRASKPQPKFESFKFSGNIDDEDTLNDYYDAENEKDLRHMKHNDELEEGVKYSKHGYNSKNLMRIYYIKEKKELMKENAEKMFNEKKKMEQEQAQAENEIENDDFGKRNKNRRGQKKK
eukprot:CAMPEP_0170514728 /NCGR_PEP_ID=MMETSP0209-20121228/1301_1 /TAXON_ID=665100 ORGANISM="Litonotus pictus, Strain P1" /NCGR_SAMPLE_ID=MMETSP0209 /ASSEMBLY_ACC=CAM_ASM_000301 /LENGTH=214 /DNA_ID=CAMNT_0010798933 /DNA_START=8 /DNA_END=655 /DNA_ORIENTATION=+